MNKQLSSQNQDVKLTPESSEVSVFEDDEFVYVEAFLPDIFAKEIKMNFIKGMLFIKAEKKIFYRVAVPGIFDETTVPKAIHKEGILKVVFTKNKNTFIKKKKTY